MLQQPVEKGKLSQYERTNELKILEPLLLILFIWQSPVFPTCSANEPVIPIRVPAEAPPMAVPLQERVYRASENQARYLYTGTNILDDYAMENRGFVHPDCMTSFSFSLGCSLQYRLTGRQTPEAILHNVPGLYENLKWFALPDSLRLTRCC